MQRRSFLKNTGLTLGALAFLNADTLAQFLADPAFKIRMLTDNIGIFTEKGGTILFMLTKEGTVVVDSQFPDSAAHLIDEIKKKTDKPFRLLINTHHHGDHTSGNIAFKGLAQHVLAHENSKKNQQEVAVKNKTEDKQLYPNQIFGWVWCEKIGRQDICLRYFGPGHTNGDAFVHFKKANIVHAGDLVFNRRHPFVDRSAGANISSWITVLEKATSTFKARTTYISGHSGEGYDVVLTKADVLAFRDYLSNVLKYTGEQIKAGKTLDEIVKNTKEIPGSPEWKGDGIDRPLKAAYEELTLSINN
ncbi:MBL fold metallo-hydrolase [Ferruginibacter sp. HRS2-29]|uniref:MBL fold metallo-hydrolase n=1 Tax=Ferruginibacter sp. HRS2-29 TaxID=2487334 RepID=UPI0020CEF191|nr:MBL fold metallo-hydrolase [Ferruginibacter sp. HRS2-29]MCP9752274.1 MBL fold metallo-hydrolase [Ferruginibacter sp. HRS2-29]